MPYACLLFPPKSIYASLCLSKSPQRVFCRRDSCFSSVFSSPPSCASPSLPLLSFSRFLCLSLRFCAVSFDQAACPPQCCYSCTTSTSFRLQHSAARRFESLRICVKLLRGLYVFDPLQVRFWPRALSLLRGFQTGVRASFDAAQVVASRRQVSFFVF